MAGLQRVKLLMCDILRTTRKYDYSEDDVHVVNAAPSSSTSEPFEEPSPSRNNDGRFVVHIGYMKDLQGTHALNDRSVRSFSPRGTCDSRIGLAVNAVFEDAMTVQEFISFAIIVFIVAGAVYDVELNSASRALHTRAFRWRRLRNWLPLGIAYAAFYMARYNVAAGNIAAVRDRLQFSSVFMGWVLSSGSWAYAATAPLTGQITDRIGGKRGMLIGCLGAAACNLLLGVLFLADVPLALERVCFVLLYALNVLVQGFGTSGVIKINAAWYSAKERGRFSGVFNILLNSGYFLSVGAGGSIISYLGWAYIFLLPATILVVMSAVIACLVESTPPPVYAREVLLSPTKTAAQLQASNRAKTRRLLANPAFLGYLGAVFCLCWARDGFLNWFLAFLDAARDKPLTPAATAVVGGAWTLGGFVGGVLCGWVSDVVFQSARALPLCIFSVFQAVLLGAVYALGASCTIELLSVLIFWTSVFLLGNNTVLSFAVPSDLPPDIAAGACGIMTALGYLAAGLSGVFTGHVVELGGYRVWAASLMVTSVLTGMFAILGSHFAHEAVGADDDALEEATELTPLSATQASKHAGGGNATMVTA